MFQNSPSCFCVSCLPLVEDANGDGFYIQTAEATSLDGPFERGSDLSLCDEDAIGDFLVPTRLANEETKEPGVARFTIAIPKSGEYTLWARMRCPSGKAESFTCAFGEGGKRYVLERRGPPTCAAGAGFECGSTGSRRR